MIDTRSPTLNLTLGLDRCLAWHQGTSVRYAVAELLAAGASTRQEAPPLNLALAIDVSGSMAGSKIEAARSTASQVVAALTPRDRLSLVAFDNKAELLLDARIMDEAGRAAAIDAIGRLRDRGGTNLWEGWMQAAERVAIAMEMAPRASHRVLLLSDGQANDGITEASELARHAAGLAERGVITSAVGIGDGYDELLLGGMAEAGGGRLHDAELVSEISEVVLGELLEGRAALLEHVTLRVVVPANLRAELVGGWAHTILPSAIEVRAGMLLPDSPKRIVFRLYCPSGQPGTGLVVGASARAVVPDGSATLETDVVEAGIRFVLGEENNAQDRDLVRSLAVLQAWQAEALRRAMTMNRDGDRRAARHFLERELRWIERYARGVADAEPMVTELVLLVRRIDEELSPRLRKEIYSTSTGRAFYQKDLRSGARADLANRLREDQINRIDPRI